MRKTVIFTMILTVIFAMAGCTVHSEPGKKLLKVHRVMPYLT